KSHSIEAFKQNLNKIANRVEFSNATKALLREIEGALPKNMEEKNIYVTEGTRTLKELRENLKHALNPILNQDIKNAQTGIIARISSTGLNKISSSKALSKSLANGFTKEEHFKVAMDIKRLFENAILKERYKDKNNSPDIKATHRYLTLLKINDKEATAKITLKESIEQGHRIYSLELEELTPLPLKPPAHL
uniref:LPD3 domain-containing protein n=1 Tax=Helicobacter suis TaxID=104628 RepID=UPI001F0720AF